MCGGSCGSCGVAWRPEVHVDKSHFVQRTTSGLDVAVCGCPEHGAKQRQSCSLAPGEHYELHMAAGGLPDFVVPRAVVVPAASPCLLAAYLHRRSVRQSRGHCVRVLCAVRVWA